ncbi:nucleotidyltransferase family protein [Flavisphingomonas formosensis]|uniref:nucleotidyltransferase family protein n=1 Tax=Flavisphingomonas formosensis TaxID=861534 RepID=UPI0012FCB3A8|nr:nucleotidyltransferase family protein [Sphingomonas formosensis]
MPINDLHGAIRNRLEPAPDDALLLRAAFAPAGEFAIRFADWARAVDGAPPRNAYTLLQLLAPRIGENDDHDALAVLCRRQYRLVWAKTRLLERRHAAILDRFAGSGIACLVLKGPALQPLYYADPGLRAMGDLDLLVQPSQFCEALAWFLARGWRSDQFARPRRFDIRFGRAVSLVNTAGDLIDLHVHAFHQQAAWAAAPGLFWAHAQPLAIAGAATATLCAEHHLIHQIEHAIADQARNSRWIADGMMLIRSGRIDWGRLIDHAETLGLAGLVSEGLQVLHAFGAEIPDAALARRPMGAVRIEAWHAIDSRLGRLRFHAGALRDAAQRAGRWPLALLPAYLRFLAARRGLPGQHLAEAPAQ